MKEEQAQFDQESLLLLYMADELPDSEKARVERMLAESEELRQQLQLLREAMDAGLNVLSELDNTSHALHEGVAQRRTTRLLRQWALERKIIPPPPMPVVRQRISWTKFGLSAAAMLLVGLTVWGVYHPSKQSPVRMPSVPLNLQDRENLLAATLGIADLDDSDDVQIVTLPRLEDMDISSDVAGRLSTQ